MALSVRNSQTEEAVRRLAKLRGISMTKAIDQAVKKELYRESLMSENDWQRRLADIELIQRRSKKLALIDPRSDDEILGFGEDGLPT